MRDVREDAQSVKGRAEVLTHGLKSLLVQIRLAPHFLVSLFPDRLDTKNPQLHWTHSFTLGL